ncbi:MAG TPA: hypothetical protein VFQ25_04715 [Ktedonobacterales bacterium]|nr:hypothetical protein [Ktedonobacterales bacterium]
MNHQSPPHHPPACATFARLAPLLDSGDLDSESQAWAWEHLKTCASCQKRFAGYEIVTAALRRHYGGMRSPVSLLTVEELMRTADMETTDMDATRDAQRTPPSAPLPPRTPQRRGWRPLATALTAAVALAVIGTLFALRGPSPSKGPAAGQTPQSGEKIVEVSLGGKLPAPTSIAVDKHGGVWVLSPRNDAIGYLYVADPTARPPCCAGYVWVASDAANHTYTGNSGLAGIAIAADGSVWFTESNANRIGRIIPNPTTTSSTSGGSVTEFSGGAITEFKGASPDGRPFAITAGANGLMWFTEVNSQPGRANGVVPIHADGSLGVVLMLPYPDPGLVSITRAPDGALWFVEANTGYIDRLNPAQFNSDPRNALKRFALPNSASDPVAIAAGPDGSVWFVERAANAIGRISASGKVTEIPVPTHNSGLANLAVAADGSVWFTESKANKIGNVSPSGNAIKEIPVPTASAQPNGIAIAPDGNVWFTETATGKLGYLKP